MRPCRPRRARRAAPPEPGVRPALVARARRLMADPAYPSTAVMRVVARRLAERFAREATMAQPWSSRLR